MRQKIFSFIKYLNLEALIWIAGLTFLAFFNTSDHHLTICPIKNSGFSFCPGCGLGQSISYIFKLEFVRSFTTHPFGVPALLILTHRIILLIANSYYTYKHYSFHLSGEKNHE